MNENGTLLELDAVDTYYGQIHILQGLSLHVNEGELVCLLGGNASGKSTTLKTILGIVRPRNGSVSLGGEDITKRPTSYRIGRGIAIVPENRRLFAPMTVLENLEMGAYLRGAGAKEDYDRVYELFPLLYERRAQLAGRLPALLLEHREHRIDFLERAGEIVAARERPHLEIFLDGHRGEDVLFLRHEAQAHRHQLVRQGVGDQIGRAHV